MIIEGLPEASRIVASPLTRCRRLAELVAQARDLPLEIDPRISEMNFGRWEGRSWLSIPRHELDAWARDLLGARPHGGESPSLLAERVGEALRDVGPEPTLWVTHSGVVRAVCALADLQKGWNTSLDFGEWISLDLPKPAPST